MLWSHCNITHAVKIHKEVMFLLLRVMKDSLSQDFMSVDVRLFIYVFVETEVGLVLLKMN